MSRHLLNRAFVSLAICTSLPLHAQTNEPHALSRCISTLTTAGAIFVRTPLPTTHLLAVSKHIDLAFHYLQGAEALARLLPQTAKNPFVMDEAVLATNPESVSKIDQRIADCEKWAKQVHENFSGNIRSEIYESTLGRMKRLSSVKY